MNVHEYNAVPAGAYLIEVAEVTEHYTRKGVVYWSLRLEIAEGYMAGRQAAFDVIHFTDRARHRREKILQALGLKGHRLSDGPDALRLRRALVEVRRVTDVRGSMWNEVPYDGWHPLLLTDSSTAPQDELSPAEFLRSLAQNDYNIDGHLLPDGKRLEEIADFFDGLVSQYRMQEITGRFLSDKSFDRRPEKRQEELPESQESDPG